MKFHFILIFTSFLIFTSAAGGCKSKKIGAPTLATKTRSVDYLQKKLKESAQPPVKSLAARAKMNVNFDGSPMQVSANLIWVKDSVLWVQVKKFGIEGARALVTRDSVFILNRLEKTLRVKSWAEVQREFNLPEGFSLLENVVLGTAWFAADMVLKSEIKDGLHQITGKNNRFSADYRIEEGAFRVRQMTFLEQNKAQAVTLGFDRFEKLDGGGSLPYLRQIEAFDPETGTTKVEIELSDVEINTSKSFKFEIPAHYRRAK